MLSNGHGFYKCSSENTLHINACCETSIKTSCCPLSKNREITKVKKDSISSKCCNKIDSKINFSYELSNSTKSISKSDSPTSFNFYVILEVKDLYKKAVYNNTDPPWRSPKVSFFLYKLHCAFLC